MINDRGVLGGLNDKSATAFKVAVSIIFGLLGFLINFHAIDFAFPPFTASVLIGLLFPMLITRAWGWKYGLLSALVGGCQSMWWIWGPSNGYAIFFVVPPFTLWIVWHGWLADWRRKQQDHHWWSSAYAAEIPFRIFSTINLYTFCRWAITLNPAPWRWAAGSSDTIPLSFSNFVVVKQAVVAFIILLLADVLLSFGFARRFFGLRDAPDHSGASRIISASLLLGVCFWVVDSVLGALVFHTESTFLDLLALEVPPYEFYVRTAFILATLAGGALAARLLRRQSESDRALRESERKYRDTIENLGKVVFRMSVPDGEFEYISPVVKDTFGYTQEEFLDTPMFIAQIMTPDSVDAFERYWADIRRGEVLPNYEYKVIDSEGNERWILQSNKAVHDDEGDIIAIEGICTDFTERKQAEEERVLLAAQVREQAQRVRQILATVPEGVILLDAGGRVTMANPAAEGHLAVLAEAQVGDTLTRLGDRSLADLLTSPPTKGLWHEAKADGRTFEVIARPIENGPEPEAWVVVILDVTRDRENQRAVQQQERLAAVGQLAAGIAHDFNNIIAVIVLYTQMALRAPDLPTRFRERLETVHRQALRATDLIQQVLDFSRRAVLERRPMDLVPFLGQVVKLLERTLPENVNTSLSYGTDEYTVSADPTRVQQVVMNLAINARDAMLPTGGGELQIGLSRMAGTDELRCVTCGDISAGEWVRMTVTDTGSGIPPDALPYVFEPFYTTKAPGEGTGLGLAQVYGIVKQHKGHIDVTTKRGEGTTFSIYLPVLLEDQPEAPAQETQTLVQGQGEVILVVEDEAALREALAESVRLLNYRVLEAANGREALSILEQHSEEVVLVLSDLVMPQMGGQALFHALRERGLTLPMVMLSGHPMEDELKSLQAQGLAGWSLKPANMERISELLARALKEG